jgi:flagellar motor switch protein FliG
MMKFDDIASMPARQMAAICLRFPVDTFSKSLVSATPELVDKFLGHLSPSIAGLIRDLVAKHGDIAEWEIEMARQRILAIVKEAIDE